MSRFQKTLQQLKDKDRLRSLALPGGIDFTSNDYLGMGEHPALRAAAMDALEGGMDIGAGGSRLLRGHGAEHEALEVYAAGAFGAEAALYFATGFQANSAIFQSLPNRHDVIIYDALVHASSREGIANSPARSVRVPHNDVDAFEAALKEAHEARRVDGTIWIAVESLYSMDGDFAPLAVLKMLADQYDAMMIVDEAHATGVNMGLMRYDARVVALHTCGKAVGVAGGLVCASREIIDTLINTARGFIYSTAPPPLQAFLCHRSLEILMGEEGDARRAALAAHVEMMGAESHIVPIVIGADVQAVRVADALQDHGYDVRAIRPPTVPEGTARLRISLSSALDTQTVREFKACLKSVMEKKHAA